jgi:hypothetical protein
MITLRRKGRFTAKPKIGKGEEAKERRGKSAWHLFSPMLAASVDACF